MESCSLTRLQIPGPASKCHFCRHLTYGKTRFYGKGPYTRLCATYPHCRPRRSPSTSPRPSPVSLQIRISGLWNEGCRTYRPYGRYCRQGKGPEPCRPTAGCIPRTLPISCSHRTLRAPFRRVHRKQCHQFAMPRRNSICGHRPNIRIRIYALSKVFYLGYFP